MKNSKYIWINLIAFIIFITIAITSIVAFTNDIYTDLFLVLLSFSLVGILIQFYFILKQVSK